MKKIGLLTLLLVTSVFTAMANVPAQFNYQSRLTKADGSPVTDGQYSVTFTIYDAPDAGNVLWSGINEVTTKGGYFYTVIGSGSQDLSGVDFTKTLYLGVRVAADAEMTPRAQLVGVPYAMRANAAIQADTADNATNATNATNAINADNATSATNADKLGNVSASGYLTKTAGVVITSYIANGAVTQAKAPWAPIVYVKNNTTPRDNTKIASGTGTLNGSGLVTVSLSGCGFTQPPIVICEGIDRANVLLMAAPTTSSFSVGGIPINSTFNWIAVGY